LDLLSLGTKVSPEAADQLTTSLVAQRFTLHFLSEGYVACGSLKIASKNEPIGLRGLSVALAYTAPWYFTARRAGIRRLVTSHRRKLPPQIRSLRITPSGLSFRARMDSTPLLVDFFDRHSALVWFHLIQHKPSDEVAGYFLLELLIHLCLFIRHPPNLRGRILPYLSPFALCCP
jgi:hypothetical protein